MSGNPITNRARELRQRQRKNRFFGMGNLAHRSIMQFPSPGPERPTCPRGEVTAHRSHPPVHFRSGGAPTGRAINMTTTRQGLYAVLLCGVCAAKPAPMFPSHGERGCPEIVPFPVFHPRWMRRTRNCPDIVFRETHRTNQGPRRPPREQVFGHGSHPTPKSLRAGAVPANDVKAPRKPADRLRRPAHLSDQHALHRQMQDSVPLQQDAILTQCSRSTGLSADHHAYRPSCRVFFNSYSNVRHLRHVTAARSGVAIPSISAR